MFILILTAILIMFRVTDLQNYFAEPAYYWGLGFWSFVALFICGYHVASDKAKNNQYVIAGGKAGYVVWLGWMVPFVATLPAPTLINWFDPLLFFVVVPSLYCASRFDRLNFMMITGPDDYKKAKLAAQKSSKSALISGVIFTSVLAAAYYFVAINDYNNNLLYLICAVTFIVSLLTLIRIFYVQSDEIGKKALKKRCVLSVKIYAALILILVAGMFIAEGSWLPLLIASLSALYLPTLLAYVLKDVSDRDKAISEQMESLNSVTDADLDQLMKMVTPVEGGGA
tara:strand:- start:18982 stop:19833 length:852 start_codon:yes stop_codon:yes gene_type:complete